MSSRSTNNSNLKAPAVTPRLAFSMTEVARYLGVSLPTVKRAITSGALRARKLGKRTIIMKTDLDQWLAGLAPRRSNHAA